LRFLSFDSQSSKSDFQNYESFLFSTFWFLFVNQSRVNLGLVKRKPLKLKHNKAFKWDSCRVAFLVCGAFCAESGLREVDLCGIHPLTQRYKQIQPQRMKNGNRVQSKPSNLS
ncbi:hypothetical protein, partial [Vibrio vulnificus]